jgi:hypothetical protein
MSYNDVAAMAQDGALQRRIRAAAEQENVQPDAGVWATGAAWKFASQPGWADAWASAVAASNPDPGSDPSVITDAEILSAVQALTVVARVGK